VSVESDPQVNVQLIEETRKQINRLFDEVARLSESDVPPADYYGEFLKRALQGLAAPAGAVWVRTPQGHLQLQHQINLREVGLEHESNRQSHDELLRHAFQQAQPLHIPPHSFAAAPDGGSTAPGNPTDFDILLVPIIVDQIVTGFVEVWQGAGRNPNAIPGFLQFLKRMAHFASVYARSHKLRQIVGQQQLWTQLENFARQVHGSLNPTEVSYLIANEGRRLIECDRVSVGVRLGKKTRIEAISGADVVEKRSNLVQLMRTLLERVLTWGEKLVYSGTKDDTLPPNVLHALDEYLAESNSKFLVALPLKDEREEEGHKPPRSALLMEAFEPNSSPEQLIARLEVVGRHATSALYNAVEHRRIPGRWIWQPVARVQEGLGGKARAIGISIGIGLVVLAAVLTFVPYPLKMEAKGQLLPEVRRWIYSPVEGRVLQFNEGVEHGASVSENQPLVLMEDLKLHKDIDQLSAEIESARRQAAYQEMMMQNSGNQAEQMKIKAERDNYLFTMNRKSAELALIRSKTHSEDLPPGQFWLKSQIKGTILNWGFRENLTYKEVRPSEPLLRIGNKNGRWEIELKIPQKHIGQVLNAFHSKDPDAELDVDVLLASKPTRVFKGKLARKNIGGEATPNRDDVNESEPIVWASVRIDGEGLPTKDQIRGEDLVPGTEIHAKIRCGQRAMGYSLFYGLWEFFYEKVVFFF
jgi:hypothetical protein